jgi:hypothetical protein
MRFVFPSQRELLVELTAFYSLVHIEWLLDRVLSHYKPGVPRVVLAKLKEQTSSDREIMQCSLASLIFDYLILACLGEARHAWGHSNGNLTELGYDSSSSRSCVVEHFAGAIAPSEEAEWNSSFGGSRWGRIAKVALRYWNKEWNAITLIDHCVDLVHNGGLAFDKGFLLYCSEGTNALQDLLDDKASRKPLHKWRGSRQLGGCVWALIRKLQGHKLIKTLGRTRWCVVCEAEHIDLNERDYFLYGDNHSLRSLADDGYLGIAWPTYDSEGTYTVGDVIIDEDGPIGHEDDEPEPACGGCDFNGNEPCDGECHACDIYHGGCDLNNNEQCHGECSECNYNEGGCEKNDNDPCNGDCADCRHQPSDCNDRHHHGCDGDCENCEYHEKEQEDDEEEEEEPGEEEEHDLSWELKQPVIVDPLLQIPLFEILNGHVIINASTDKLMQAVLAAKALDTTCFGEVYETPKEVTWEALDFARLFVNGDKLVFFIIK